MKKIAKIITLALCLTMLLTLCACGGGTGGATPTPTSGGTGSGSGESTVLTDNVLTMGTNAFFPPYEFYQNEKVVGIDAEIAEAIATLMGMEFEIVDMDFDSLIAAVSTGKIDMAMAGMTVTEDRKLQINFSTSYATGIQSIIVPVDSDIAGIEDLDGKLIGVQFATTGDIYATDDYGEDAVRRFDKGTAAVMELLNGGIDCIIIDNEPAKSFVAANAGLKILETEYAVEEYAIAIAKDNSEFLEKVDNALLELIDGGTVQAIIDKYIPPEG